MDNMKTVICFLAAVAVAVATAFERAETYSVSESLVGVFEGIRDDMPCGFPLLGIGPLAPAFVSQKTLNISKPSLKVLGEVQNFTVKYMNLFEIIDVRHSAIKRKIIFSLAFEKIEFDTWYDLKADFEKAGWTVKFNGSGKANFALKDLLVSGTIKYGIRVANGKIFLKAFKIKPHLESAESNIEGILGDGAINKKFNEKLEIAVPFFVNTFADAIANKFQNIIMPEINRFLDRYTLNDIINGVGGNSAEGEKIKCEPKLEANLSF